MNTSLDSLLENTGKTMTAIIKHVANGPRLSKHISCDEARAGKLLALNCLADLVQAAIFLIGLLVKRETTDENKGLWQAILDRTEIIEVEVDELVDIADPYNGYACSLPSSPFY